MVYTPSAGLATFTVPGLDEKPPYGFAESIPNCYACKENYANRPLFSGCDGCEEAVFGALSDEELFRFAEASRDEPTPQLVRDPIGGLILPLVGNQ